MEKLNEKIMRQGDVLMVAVEDVPTNAEDITPPAKTHRRSGARSAWKLPAPQ